MDRRKFMQRSSLGLGFALLPSITKAISPMSNSNRSSDPKIIRDQEGNVLNVIGDIQTHKLVGAETDNQLVEWVDNVDPGVGIPPHIHTMEDEIFRVVKGQVEIQVGDQTTVLEAGDVAYAPKHIAHSWKVVGKEKAKMITTAFPAGIEHMFKELSDLPPGPPDFQQVAEICGKRGIRFV